MNVGQVKTKKGDKSIRSKLIQIFKPRLFLKSSSKIKNKKFTFLQIELNTKTT